MNSAFFGGSKIRNALIVIAMMSLFFPEAQVRIVTLDNQVYQGKIVDIGKSPDCIVLQVEDIQRRIECLDIVEVVCQDKLREPGRAPRVFLNDGSQICGEIADGDDRSLTLSSPFLGTLAVDLPYVREIRFLSGSPPDPADTENDVVYFKNGDVMKCMIYRFGKGWVEVEHEQLGMRREVFENIDRITFAQLDSVPAPSPKLSAVVCGVDRSKLRGEIVALRKNKLYLRASALEREFVLDLGQIQRFFFVNGRFVYLSDLPADQSKVKYIPCFGGYEGEENLWYLPKLDSNQRGGPLCLSRRLQKERPALRERQIFSKGIGVLSRTEIRVGLDQKYRKFQSHIGLDDSVRESVLQDCDKDGGSVVFQVFVDGAKKFDSGILDWDSDFQMIEVDITGKKELLLVVDYGDPRPNDLANWAGARLVK